MEEAKLNMINASQQAVSLVDTMAKKGSGVESEIAAATAGFDGPGSLIASPSTMNNMEELKESIAKAKRNLMNEEAHLKDSIKSFENTLDRSFNNSQRGSRFGGNSRKSANSEDKGHRVDSGTK